MLKSRWFMVAAAAALFPLCMLTVTAEDGKADAPAPAVAKADTASLSADQQAAVEAHAAVAKAADAVKKEREPITARTTEIADLLKAVNIKLKNPEIGSDEKAALEKEKEALTAESNDLRKKSTALNNKTTEANKALAAAFAKTDWAKWDLATHSKLVGDGLQAVVSTSDGKHAETVKACEFALKSVPDCTLAKSCLSGTYPNALAEIGDFATAITKLKAAHAAASDTQKPGIAQWIGDFQCLTGNTDMAAATYEAAVKSIPEGLEARDPRVSAKRYLETRTATIGKVAHEIDSKTWLGGEARSLSSMKGNVVVMDFWATWCPPCRAIMPGLSELAKEHKKDGVYFWGVCKQETRGALPKTKEALPTGPYEQWTATKDLAPAEAFAEFMDHLKAFHKVCELSYPFVVSNAKEQAPYKVVGIPTMFVVGKDGKIMFCKVGGGSETMLKAALKLAIKAPAPTKAPASGAPAAPAADATKGDEKAKADASADKAPAGKAND